MVENNNYIPDANGNTPDIMPQVPPLDVVRRHGSGVYADDLIHNADDDKKPDFLPKRDWQKRDVSRFQLDMTKPLKKPQYLLASNGVQFSMLKGFLCITGQAGHGKTATIALLIAAILKGEIGNLTYEQKEEIPTPKVVYIDTEQEEYYTKLLAHRVCSMVGWEREQNHEQLEIYNLREEPDTNDRWADIIKIIDDTRPTVAIIDGLLDVVNNQNEMDECAPIINECLAIASHYKLAFWTVIHQNPNSNSKMSGNLGSMAERKAGDVMSTAKSKDEPTGFVTFEVKQLKARGKDMDNWLFRIDWDDTQHLALPCPIVSVTPKPDAPKDPEQVKAERMQELAAKYGALNIGKDGITLYELQHRITGKKGRGKSGTIWNEVNEMLEYGMMTTKYDDKQVVHFLYHGITSQPQPKQTEMQFNENQGTSTPEPDGNGLPF